MKYQLLQMIVCPICLNSFFLDLNTKELICKVDNLAFPIIQGIPVLLKKKARCCIK